MLAQTDWLNKGYQFGTSLDSYLEAKNKAKEYRQQGYSAKIDFRFGSGTYFIWIKK